MSLGQRLAPDGPPTSEPEDVFAAARGALFTDMVDPLHGSAGAGLRYTSPHLPRPLRLTLVDPAGDQERYLFGQYVWNAALLLAELMEAGSLGLELGGGSRTDGDRPVAAAAAAAAGGGGEEGDGPRVRVADFAVRGLATIELGAGAGLPSLVAAQLGARRVAITDYPSPRVVANLHANVARNADPSGTAPPDGVLVEAHRWGDTSTPLAQGNAHVFDRVLAADCLWMPEEHDGLRRSIAWFLRGGDGDGGGGDEDSGARAWIVAGFHTGRAVLASFFDAGALAAAGLAVEWIVERDYEGRERAWAVDRGVEHVDERKRWMVVAVLKRTRRP